MENTIIEDVIESLQAFSNEKRIGFIQNYCPTSMQIMGITNPNLKIVLKELTLATKELNNGQKLEIAKKLVTSNIFEAQQLGYMYIEGVKKLQSALTENDIDDLFHHLDNWVSVDTYSLYISGYAWRENVISTEKLRKWYQSENFWYRRVPIVSTVALNLKSRGGTGDASRTLEVCSWAVEDHKDLINKAMSWALRELAKREPDQVIGFMKKYEGQIHPRVKKEVFNKITTGKKNP